MQPCGPALLPIKYGKCAMMITLNLNTPKPRKDVVKEFFLRPYYSIGQNGSALEPVRCDQQEYKTQNSTEGDEAAINAM